MGDILIMGAVSMVKNQTYEELTARIKTLEKELQQRVQTETDLLEQEQKYRLIFEKARDAIFIIQSDVIRFANRRARTVLVCAGSLDGGSAAL